MSRLERIFVGFPDGISKGMAKSATMHFERQYRFEDIAQFRTAGFYDAMQRHRDDPEKPKTKTGYKAAVDEWIAESRDALAPYRVHTPEMTIHSDDISVRRMVRLAQILSPEEAITPCVAVAITKTGLVVSCNRSIDPAAHPEAKIHEHINARLTILRTLFKDYADAMTSEGRLAALNDAADQLIANSGCCKIMPETKAKRRRDDRGQRDMLISELRKVTHSVLTADGGFSTERSALLRSDMPLTFIYPRDDYETRVGARLHAEQAMVDHLGDLRSELTDGETFIVGITKLACNACDSVLREADFITYQGSHGKTYSPVVTIHDDAPFDDEKLYDMRAQDVADDSDSTTDDDRFEMDDDVVSVADSGSRSLSRSVLSMSLDFSLFSATPMSVSTPRYTASMTPTLTPTPTPGSRSADDTAEGGFGFAIGGAGVPRAVQEAMARAAAHREERRERAVALLAKADAYDADGEMDDGDDEVSAAAGISAATTRPGGR